MEADIKKIRQAEAQSHKDVYRNFDLFSEGSWLSKPVKTVMDILPYFNGYKELHVLDLGCGVGRNCIPIAQFFQDIFFEIDCVDILELSIDMLTENAKRFGIFDGIHGIVGSIDDYVIIPDHYDLIIAVSSLEHVASKEIFHRKLTEISRGLRNGGIGCFILNAGVQEYLRDTGEALCPQFEVNLPMEELKDLMESTFHGWSILKHTVVHRQFSIPREKGIAVLDTDVVTYVFQRKETMNF